MKKTDKIYNKVFDQFEAYRKNLGYSDFSTDLCEDFVHINRSGYNQGFAYYAFNLKENKIFWEKDLENVLTKSNAEKLSKWDILGLTHISHRRILAYLLHGLFPIFSSNLEFKNDLYQKKYFIRIGRGFLEKSSGQYWWVVQSIFPLHFDENKNMVSFFCTLMVEDRYRGDSVFVNIVPNYSLERSKTEREIQVKFQKLKYSVIDMIFTEKEKEILETVSTLMKEAELKTLITDIKMKFEYKDIADKIGIESKTLKKHYDKIREKAKPFSINHSFKNIQDLVIFLRNGDFMD
jgi:hypothetical protein